MNKDFRKSQARYTITAFGIFVHILGTDKSFSEALILASTNPQYDKRLFIDLPVLTRKLQAQNMLCT